MKKLLPLVLAAILISLFSCEKEYSNENTGGGSDLIVGVDCRISKIVYTDTSGTSIGLPGTGLGSIAADIDNLDIVTEIRLYDSLAAVLEYWGQPVYRNDTVYISPDEYFVADANKRITKMHGLIDPTDPFSLQFDVFYAYNTAGYLVTKTYFLTTTPTVPFYKVDYTYAGGGNLAHMAAVNLPSGDLNMDADITYYNLTVPRRFIYLFPDEVNYAQFTQFFNFGAKNFNAPKEMKVRNYDPGNVVRDSLVSTFSNYRMSNDTYILSVQMGGDDQPSIPALAGKLSFSYKCK
ncbi:MAG: hypothetical protein JNM14_06500 [Ferruginibacter sp.]|nr:hypothetical protein [Ferruginibacter sp.]